MEKKEQKSLKNQLDWKFVMPSRKAVPQYMQDAAALNFQHVAEYMQAAKKAGGVITLGICDTVKLSGRTAFDVKTGIVIRRRREETKNFQGEDSAETVTVFLSTKNTKVS